MNERANLDGLTPGMPVFDALGAAVGPVETIGSETFRVAGQELPASAIARVERDGVYLHLARAVLGAAQAGEGTTAGAGERIVIPLAEERISVDTREIALGEVIIRKRVVEEKRMVPTTFRREEVEVVRRGPGENWPLGEMADGAEITRIPIRSWEPIVGTEAFVDREVIIEKARVAEEGQVVGTVRREQVTVDDRYAQARPVLEREFAAAQAATAPGTSARDFTEAEPHYRAGFRAGSDPRYAGRDFAEVEPAIRRGYDTTNKYSDDAWARLRQEIRAGYEAARRD